jgi:hypothetical protein
LSRPARRGYVAVIVAGPASMSPLDWNCGYSREPLAGSVTDFGCQNPHVFDGDQ